MQVAAGSVVLRNLPARTTAAGVPAKVIGVATEGRPSETVDQNLKHVLYHKGSNGNGNSGSGTPAGSRNGGSLGSGAGGAGTAARRNASGAARKGSVGLRGIEEKRRSFL